VLLSVIIVLGVGVGLSVYTLTKPKAIAPLPLLPDAPKYVCAEGTPQSECAQLKLTCGNGVIDYGETCNNCAFDAGCASGLICGQVNNSLDYACRSPVGMTRSGPSR
jgi:hypothetical protein